MKDGFNADWRECFTVMCAAVAAVGVLIIAICADMVYGYGGDGNDR